MDNMNICKAVKKIAVKELKYFLFENYYRKMGFPKENK